MAVSERKRIAQQENAKKANAAKLARRIPKTCEHCGVVFSVPPSTAARAACRFCSNVCRYAVMRGEHGANAGGGGWMIGAGNPRWKGGPDREPARDAALVSRWRRRVYARDMYVCRRCGWSGGKRLSAHHIVPWAESEALRFDVSNGATLCIPCHRWVHSPLNTGGEWLLASA